MPLVYLQAPLYNYLVKRFLLTILTILSVIIAITLSVYYFFKPFLPFADYILGITQPTSFLILLGNDTEMRANGGFAGSYAKITLSPPVTRYIPKISLDFQDIYVPDGQVKDYVQPPGPIQQAFGHGTWQLANADWEPDFPTSSKAIRWFFEKGKEINPDILAIINLSTIKEIVSIVDTFPVPEFNSTITPDNLYLFLQGKAEVGFFPGSTQKKDALYAVGQAFFKKIKTLPLSKKIKIAFVIYQDLTNKNIVLNSKDQDFQNLLHDQKYDGSFSAPSGDSYALIETNLGANKANAYLTRQTTHNINYLPDNTSPVIPGTDPEYIQPNSISHQVSVKFHNSSPEAAPNPPFHYGGIYIAYLRFYIPKVAVNIAITQNNSPYFPTATQSSTPTVIPDPSPYPSTPVPSITTKYGFTEIGFFHTTQAGGESSIGLTYELPTNTTPYSLTILKQNGMRSSPQQITIDQKTLKTDLTNDCYYKKSPR